MGRDTRPFTTCRPPPQNSATIRAIKFVPPDRTVFVLAKVDGHQVNAVVDTAGQVTVLSHSFVSTSNVKTSHTELILLRGVEVDRCMNANLIHGHQLTIGPHSFP